MRSILEVGCGTGAVMRDVAVASPRATVVGVDLDQSLIAYATRAGGSPNLTYILADVTAGIRGSFDFIYSIDVVHHFPAPGDGIRAIGNLLSDRGRWLLIEPNVWHPYIAWQQESMKRAGLGEDHFRPWRLLPEMRAAGMRVVDHRFMHLWPGTIKQPSAVMISVERVVERVPVLGGSAIYVLERVPVTVDR